MTNYQLWQAALGEIELNLSKANFITWFSNTDIIENRNGQVLIGVPSTFIKDWLENKYYKLILKSLRNISPEIKEVKFKILNLPIKDRKAPKIKKPKKELPIQESQPAFQEIDNDFKIDKQTNLNPKYTFDSFVVGSFNEVAYAASQAVINKIGEIYNPLFIYGGVGLGKTHLLQAIGNEIIKKYNNQKKVGYFTSEKFISEIINAIQDGEMKNIKEKYRKFDVLIIDDVQFLAGKQKVQEEFFHIFNALYQKNNQIIISSDRPAKAIPNLQERLCSRFEGGMLADISYPDIETRIAILKTKSRERGFEIKENILTFIATHIQKNIRELEGALNRVILYSKVNKFIPNENQIKKILSNIISSPKKKTNYKNIIKIVSDFYEVDANDLINKSRKKELVWPRQIVMYLMREELRNSYPFIGEKLGGRDHTTVMYACEKVSKEIENNESLQEEVNLIKERIYS